MIHKRPLLLLLLVTPGFILAQTSYNRQVKTLDAYIQKGMDDWKVPGLSMAVVKDGQVIFNRGYGESDIESGNEVTTSTRFMIGSTTKAMTAYALALLVDEGKLRWEDKVIDHFPGFQLADPFITREINIIDLLSHRAGFGNTDFLWSLNAFSSEEVVRRMRHVETAYPFRAGYTYQNIMYLVAGMVVENISGQTWEDFMAERVFKPLEMTRSRALYTDLEGESDFVAPHYLVEDRPEIIPFLTADKIAPAGSIWSTSEDMTHWMLMLLDSGTYKGERLLSEARISELWGTYNIIPQSQFYPTATLTRPNWTTYGLGWFQHDYEGYKLQFHTGSLPGLTAIIGLVPELDFGVYVFGNLDHAELRHALMYKAIDLFNDLGDRDWNKEFYELYRQLAAEQERQGALKTTERVEGTNHSLPLKEYTGEYQDELYGTMRVELDNGNLKAIFDNGFEATLSHWHYDTFRGEWSTAYSTPDQFTFELNEIGKIEHLRFNIFQYQKLK